MLQDFMNSPLFQWVILPLLIFLARALDMTLSTLRIVFIAQGRRRLAPLIGFFESLVWLMVIGQVLQHLSNPVCFIAYAAGFSMGNLVGLRLEERLAIGVRILRIIMNDDFDESAERLVARLREIGLGVTVVDGQGMKGPVKILFTLVHRRDLGRALDLVRGDHPDVFFSVEDVRQAKQGLLPLPATAKRRGLRRVRKSK